MADWQRVPHSGCLSGALQSSSFSSCRGAVTCMYIGSPGEYMRVDVWWVSQRLWLCYVYRATFSDWPGLSGRWVVRLVSISQSDQLELSAVSGLACVDTPIQPAGVAFSFHLPGYGLSGCLLYQWNTIVVHLFFRLYNPPVPHVSRCSGLSKKKKCYWCFHRSKLFVCSSFVWLSKSFWLEPLEFPAPYRCYFNMKIVTYYSCSVFSLSNSTSNCLVTLITF